MQRCQTTTFYIPRFPATPEVLMAEYVTREFLPLASLLANGQKAPQTKRASASADPYRDDAHSQETFTNASFSKSSGPKLKIKIGKNPFRNIVSTSSTNSSQSSKTTMATLDAAPPTDNADTALDQPTSTPFSLNTTLEIATPAPSKDKRKRETISNGDDADEEEDKPRRKPKKCKKTSKSVNTFFGNPTGLGTSSNPPEGANLKAPWRCANPSCTTGQTWTSRKETGRKWISNFFGGNNNSAKAIPDDVWHWFCRKDYQQANYKADKLGNQAQAELKLSSLEAQFARLRLWRPNMTFNVVLNTSANLRLSEYHRALRGGMTAAEADAAGIAAIKNATKGGKKKAPSLEMNFPMTALLEFSNTFCGSVSTPVVANWDRIAESLAWMRVRVASKAIPTLAPVQFLLNAITPGEAGVTEPSDNYDAWLATGA